MWQCDGTKVCNWLSSFIDHQRCCKNKIKNLMISAFFDGLLRMPMRCETSCTISIRERWLNRLFHIVFDYNLPYLHCYLFLDLREIIAIIWGARNWISISTVRDRELVRTWNSSFAHTRYGDWIFGRDASNGAVVWARWLDSFGRSMHGGVLLQRGVLRQNVCMLVFFVEAFPHKIAV